MSCVCCKVLVWKRHVDNSGLVWISVAKERKVEEEGRKRRIREWKGIRGVGRGE